MLSCVDGKAVDYALEFGERAALREKSMASVCGHADFKETVQV